MEKGEGKKHEAKESKAEKCSEVKCDMGGPGSAHSKSVKASMQGRKDYN